MIETIPAYCPYCGESVEVDVDTSGGEQQSYVEDCPVCCRPWDVHIWVDEEGQWGATLHTADE